MGLAVIMAPTIALPQDEQPMLIDRDLRGQWDFRDLAFSGCFEQTECFALGVTITGQRRDEDDVTWVPAQLYWDPVDGIGVMAGGQNDEIDFDERVLVTFEGSKGGTVNIDRVWLSDIFIGEDERYGSNDPADPDDVEVAVLRSLFAGTLLDEQRVDGADVLPPDPFNEEVIAGFEEGADLFRRIVVQNDTLTVIVPGTAAGEEMQRWSFPLSDIDEERLALFEGLETVEIDLSNILAGFNDVPFSTAGTANAEMINDILDDLAELQAIREQAADTRLVGSVSNGELGVEMDEALDVEVLIFSSVLGGSNDYSVAGIVQATQ
ncbi:hypothetical protein [Jannaschia sp. CCS1]|uniref:hypothetical protein n=1 Tax=Jannaschia sp. (strain CCS1) TaxID=290400 RepID=UPI001A926FE5|nr:hypothetical protein [Jannaschia sp. CCS1]